MLHAVVGVWDAGWTITRRGPGERTTQRVATILDWGFHPDRPTDLEGAVRAACSLDALAVDIERFEVAVPTVPEPHDTAARGIYVDPVYF